MKKNKRTFAASRFTSEKMLKFFKQKGNGTRRKHGILGMKKSSRNDNYLGNYNTMFFY